VGVRDNDSVAPINLDLRVDQGVEVVLAMDSDGRTRLTHDALASSVRFALNQVSLLAPLPAPTKIFGIGLNYSTHIAESGLEPPPVPTVFAMFPSSVCAPGEPIVVPSNSTKVDYEGELGVVIGTRCRHVSANDADRVIGGYTIVNDVSARDWQLRTPQWSLGKSFDTHTPIGPWVTSANEVNVGELQLRTWVNSELRQDARTSELVFSCRELVAFLSQVCTLLPGDVIATGTPGGVGGAMTPPRYLAAGDEVRIEIEGLGALVNPVVDEARASALADQIAVGSSEAG
jgi:2-keto-4-pentenoate hydratase/2-oxohepta-3-ene-1,7-dioic acid hydratase in catechol pathway